MNKFEKVIISLIGLLIIAALVFGVVVFSRQKAIRNIENGSAKEMLDRVLEKNNAGNGLSLTSVETRFAGEITNISGNELTVSVKLNKPKNPEKLKNVKNPMQLTGEDFEVFEKSVKVNINADTVWVNKNFSDVKVGNLVDVFADKSPYEQDIVTAERIGVVTKPQ